MAKDLHDYITYCTETQVVIATSLGLPAKHGRWGRYDIVDGFGPFKLGWNQPTQTDQMVRWLLEKGIKIGLSAASKIEDITDGLDYSNNYVIYVISPDGNYVKTFQSCDYREAILMAIDDALDYLTTTQHN